MSDDEHSDDGLNNQEVDELSATMMRYFLMQSISKFPIKKADLVAHCLRGNKRQFKQIYDIAELRLKEVYGLGVFRVQGIKAGQQFLCVSTEANPFTLNRSSAQTKTLPLLFLVLAYIFLKGGSLSEIAIFSFLEKVGIDSEETTNPHFGNVKKLLTDTFVKQMYLKKTKTITEPNNDVRITLEWGQRALLEFKRSDVLNIVANIMQKPAIAFKRQYDEAAAADAIDEANEDMVME